MLAGVLVAIANDQRSTWVFVWPWLWGFLFLGFTGVMGYGLRPVADPLFLGFGLSQLVLVLYAIYRSYRHVIACLLMTIATVVMALATVILAGIQMSGDSL